MDMPMYNGMPGVWAVEWDGEDAHGYSIHLTKEDAIAAIRNDAMAFDVDVDDEEGDPLLWIFDDRPELVDFHGTDCPKLVLTVAIDQFPAMVYTAHFQPLGE